MGAPRFAGVARSRVEWALQLGWGCAGGLGLLVPSPKPASGYALAFWGCPQAPRSSPRFCYFGGGLHWHFVPAPTLCSGVFARALRHRPRSRLAGPRAPRSPSRSVGLRPPPPLAALGLRSRPRGVFPLPSVAGKTPRRLSLRESGSRPGLRPFLSARGHGRWASSGRRSFAAIFASLRAANRGGLRYAPSLAVDRQSPSRPRPFWPLDSVFGAPTRPPFSLGFAALGVFKPAKRSLSDSFWHSFRHQRGCAVTCAHATFLTNS